MTVNEVPPTAGRREWIGLAVLALPTLLVSIDVFVLLLALPHLSTALGASGVQQLWIVDIYGFMAGGFLVTMGTLGDRIGRRKLLLIGAAVFALASALAAYSTSPGMLIAARALLGIAGATLAPSTLALISNMFRDNRQRSLAIGIWAGCFTVGAIIGPILGGVMLARFWWGSVFLLALPAMILLLLLGPVLLPEYRNENAGRLDLVSVALSLLAILPFVFGVKEVVRDSSKVIPLLAIAIGLTFGFLFVRRQGILDDPILDISLFKNRAFRTALVSLLAYSLLTGCTMLFITQHFQSVEGMSSLRSGLGLLPGMLVSTVSVLVAPMLAWRIRPAYLIAGGLAIVVAGLVVVMQVGANSGPAVLIIGFAIWCFGGGPLLALGTGLVIGSVPPEKIGSASSMPQVSNEFGAALGIAMIGSIGSLVYRVKLGNHLPLGTSASTAHAARESMAGARTAAASLPDGGAPLIQAARSAFTSGLQTVAGISAVVLAAVAVLVLVQLRSLEPMQAVSADGADSEGQQPVLDGAESAAL